MMVKRVVSSNVSRLVHCRQWRENVNAEMVGEVNFVMKMSTNVLKNKYAIKFVQTILGLINVVVLQDFIYRLTEYV